MQRFVDFISPQNFTLIYLHSFQKTLEIDLDTASLLQVYHRLSPPALIAVRLAKLERIGHHTELLLMNDHDDNTCNQVPSMF